MKTKKTTNNLIWDAEHNCLALLWRKVASQDAVTNTGHLIIQHCVEGVLLDQGEYI